MKFVLLALASTLVVGICLTAVTSINLEIEWQSFKSRFNKSYKTTGEEQQRKLNFAQTLAQVQEFNRKSRSDSPDNIAKATYEQEINHLADLSNEELGLTPSFGYNSTQINIDRHGTKHHSVARLRRDLGRIEPEHFDWSVHRHDEVDVVTSVKDERPCEASSAYAAAGVIEGQIVRRKLFKYKTKKSKILKQEVNVSVDFIKNCALSGNPCKWIGLEHAFGLMYREQGVYSEPKYLEKVSKSNIDCDTSMLDIKMKIYGVVPVPQGDEEWMRLNLREYGPIAVSFYAPESFKTYKRGIYSDDDVDIEPKLPNRSALLVGYGNDSKLGKYWILKNSWGRNWGMKGYFWLKRGENALGVASHAYFVSFEPPKKGSCKHCTK